jgi:hypothetical protein
MGEKIVNDCYYVVERWRYWYLFRGNYGAKKEAGTTERENGVEAV